MWLTRQVSPGHISQGAANMRPNVQSELFIKGKRGRRAAAWLCHLVRDEILTCSLKLCTVGAPVKLPRFAIGHHVVYLVEMPRYVNREKCRNYIHDKTPCCPEAGFDVK
jgi:hypothetical protein